MSAETCLNCGSIHTERFCAHCGQRTVPAYPSVRQFAGDAWEEFVGVDGRLLRTVRDLARPGQLTVDTMEGRRACHIGALRLYLFASVLFFLISALAPNLGATKARIPGKEDVNIDFSNPESLTPEQIALARKNVEDAPWLLKPFFEEVLKDPVAWRQRMSERMPRALFALVPVLAGLLALFFRRRPFAQHLIFALHLQTMIFIVLAVAELATFTHVLRVVLAVNIAAWLLIAWYGLSALHRAYAESWTKTALKAGGVAILFLVAWLMAMAVLLISTVWL
jgi:hypothetical protein